MHLALGDSSCRKGANILFFQFLTLIQTHTNAGPWIHVNVVVYFYLSEIMLKMYLAVAVLCISVLFSQMDTPGEQLCTADRFINKFRLFTKQKCK